MEPMEPCRIQKIVYLERGFERAMYRARKVHNELFKWADRKVALDARLAGREPYEASEEDEYIYLKRSFNQLTGLVEIIHEEIIMIINWVVGIETAVYLPAATRETLKSLEMKRQYDSLLSRLENDDLATKLNFKDILARLDENTVH